VSATQHTIELVRAAAAAADAKLAENPVAFDVSEQLAITDAFLILSARNEPHVNALVDAVEDRLRELGVKPARREGERESRWVLLDFLDLVVHIQLKAERELYSLERLWKDCPRIDLQLPEAASRPDAPEDAELAGVAL
jgi:ribosome-associated protein